MGQGTGRDHHILSFSLWMAGGGIKGGVTYGATDELGYRAVEDVVHVRDLHATMLHLCGIDHRRLSFKYQGLDVRLTGVETRPRPEADPRVGYRWGSRDESRQERDDSPHRAASGRRTTGPWTSCSQLYREPLSRMVELRLDWRLRAKVAVSDVLREAHDDAADRLDAYLRDPGPSPLLWLRSVVGERLVEICRRHPGTHVRENGSEITLRREAVPMAVSAALASMLLGRPTPSTAAALRADRLVRLEEALNTLDPIDREVLALRHFEQLGRDETALVLGITEEAGARRYIHALGRLKEILASIPPGPVGIHRDASDDSMGDFLLDRLAEEFAERCRRGERPTIEEYTGRYPELADADPRAVPDAGRDRARRGGASRARRPRRPSPGSSRWATTGSCARSGGAGWGWSTRPSSSRSAAGWP